MRARSRSSHVFFHTKVIYSINIYIITSSSENNLIWFTQFLSNEFLFSTFNTVYCIGVLNSYLVRYGNFLMINTFLVLKWVRWDAFHWTTTFCNIWKMILHRLVCSFHHPGLIPSVKRMLPVDTMTPQISLCRSSQMLRNSNLFRKSAAWRLPLSGVLRSGVETSAWNYPPLQARCRHEDPRIWRRLLSRWLTRPPENSKMIDSISKEKLRLTKSKNEMKINMATISFQYSNFKGWWWMILARRWSGILLAVGADLLGVEGERCVFAVVLDTLPYRSSFMQ